MSNVAIMARLGLDAGRFRQNLATAKQDLASFAQQAKGALGGLKIPGGIAGVGGAAVAAVGYAVKETIAYASALQDSSDALGINVEALQELNFAFGQTGANGETVAKSLSKLGETLTSAREGDEKAIATFDKLGVSLDNIKKMTPDQVLMQIAASAGQATDPAARLTAIMDVMGKSGQKMAAGLNGGVQELRALRSEAEKLTKEETSFLDGLGDIPGKIANKGKVMFGKQLYANSQVFTGEGLETSTAAPTADELAAAKAATKKRKSIEYRNEQLGVEPPKPKTDKEEDDELKRSRELAAINAELELKGAEGRAEAVKEKAGAAEIDRKAAADYEYAQARILAGEDQRLQLAAEEAAIRKEMAATAAKMDAAESVKDAAELRAELTRQGIALEENFAAQTKLEKARRDAFEDATGDTQVMALEITGQKDAADALRSKLDWEKKIRAARDGNNSALAEEYTKQQALAAQAEAKRKAEKNADANKATLEDLAENAHNEDGRKAREALKLRQRAKEASDKGQVEKAGKLNEQARLKELGISALKESEKDREGTGAASASGEPSASGRSRTSLTTGGLTTGKLTSGNLDGLSVSDADARKPRLAGALKPALGAELQPRLAEQVRQTTRSHDIKSGIRGIRDGGKDVAAPDYTGVLNQILGKMGAKPVQNL